MSKIRDIRLVALECALPDGQAYGMARGLTARRGGGIVQVETEDGVTGIGEAWGPTRIAAAYLDIVKPYFLGTSVFGQRAVQQMVFAKHYHFGTQNQMIGLFSGIDVASHDAMGKLLKVPVTDLIGGRQRTHVPVYASGGYFTRDTDQQAALARQLEPLVGRGFPAFKIKIGRNPAEDEARVKLAKQIIGESAVLTVDSNGNYTVDLVLESMRRIAAYGIGWYEEPLAPQDWKGYAELRPRAPVPVATGEALYEAFDLRRLIDGRMADVVQPDLALCGGFSVGRFVAELCAAEHLRLSPHVWGTAVGLAAAVHWVASLPTYPHSENVPFPTLVEYDTGDNPLRDRLLATPLTAVDGRIAVPTGPGLGIELDPAVVAKYTVR
ncbi:MAG: mandelate racemase/muconate lactonizing enzyme family protein [Alphaproteobacteria bacterium]|nr:mandelate racemase/muconate lactonizing enzyme family protein [Alphaproteobacteria bacterium]